MPLMIHVWCMVTENCVWQKILECCAWRLILKYCVWRVILKHCTWHPSDASQTPHFEIKRQTQHSKIICFLWPTSYQGCSLFWNYTSDFKIRRQAQDFKIFRQMQDFKIRRQMLFSVTMHQTCSTSPAMYYIYWMNGPQQTACLAKEYTNKLYTIKCLYIPRQKAGLTSQDLSLCLPWSVNHVQITGSADIKNKES